MNFTLWAGLAGAGLLIYWGVVQAGAAAALFNPHGLGIVLGGAAATVCINCPFRHLWSAALRFATLLLPSRTPSAEEVIAELVRLARKAQAEGGALALQDESKDFADGFLHRAILVMISAGESSETRRVLEAQIRQVRVARQEDANVFRTVGVLSPMFGLLGTLLGMIRVLETMSEPNKVGPAMAMALSSAFYGIGVANFICIPVAGLIRLQAMRETLALEMMLEGVLDLASGKAPYLVELHLASYSRSRRLDMEAREGAAGRPAAA